MAPNGLIAHLYGPLEGKRDDAFMLGVSGLLPQLERITKPDGEPYVVYGDPAYGISRHIKAPFRGAHLTPLQQQFNSDMSKVRASVELGFGKISQYFAYLVFSKIWKSFYSLWESIMQLEHFWRTATHASMVLRQVLFLSWSLHPLKYTYPTTRNKQHLRHTWFYMLTIYLIVVIKMWHTDTYTVNTLNSFLNWGVHHFFFVTRGIAQFSFGPLPSLSGFPTIWKFLRIRSGLID